MQPWGLYLNNRNKVRRKLRGEEGDEKVKSEGSTKVRSRCCCLPRVKGHVGKKGGGEVGV